jgi:hypothetical protein
MTESFTHETSQNGHQWTVSEYLGALAAGERVDLPDDSVLRGRIMRGMNDKDFELLGSAERDLVFIMGPDGLSELPGIDPYTALDRIALTRKYVAGRIRQGYSFRLLVFPGGDGAPLATWDNALDMVAGIHPELSDDIETHRDALKHTPFKEFAKDVSESLDDIQLAGPSHPDYMSLEKYLQLPAHERANPAKLRRLLFHVEHLGTYFSGDGRTAPHDGVPGIKEYLVPNMAVSSLPDAQVVEYLTPGKQ